MAKEARERFSFFVLARVKGEELMVGARGWEEEKVKKSPNLQPVQLVGDLIDSGFFESVIEMHVAHTMMVFSSKGIEVNNKAQYWAYSQQLYRQKLH